MFFCPHVYRWKIDFHTKFVHWDCSWDVEEDSSLLKGVYEYGMGNWESIKMDSDLHLYDKVSQEHCKGGHLVVIMPPTLKKWGHIGFGLSMCVCVCIHVRDIVLKLHVWIPHGEIADAYFWFSLNYLPLSNYGPLTNKGMKFCKCRIIIIIIISILKPVFLYRGLGIPVSRKVL